MTINQMKTLKVGDVIVKVRKNYQNYDFTLVPCEPRVCTVIWRGSGEISFKEDVKRSFIVDGTRVVHSHGCDNSFICSCYETLDDYLEGEYNKAIILDKNKWSSEKEFLLFKMENDHKIARQEEDSRVKKEDKVA